MYPEQLNNVYKKQTDGDVNERILLVKRVRIDSQEASRVAERELHKSRWCAAYKWLDRFDEHRLERLKDRSRSGRPPPFIPEKKMLKIRQEEIFENPSAGWQVKQVMDIIYKKNRHKIL